MTQQISKVIQDFKQLRKQYDGLKDQHMALLWDEDLLRTTGILHLIPAAQDRCGVVYCNPDVDSKGRGYALHRGVRKDKSPVVLKRIQKDHIKTLAQMRALANEHWVHLEVERAGRHPALAAFIGAFCTKEDVLFVKELLDGPTLERRLNADESMPLDDELAVLVIASMSAGVAFLHSCGLVHREVSPETVILCADGRIVFGDLSLCCHTETLRGEASTAHSWTTVRGCGAMGYFGPEVIAEEFGAVEEAADVWSLGAVALECLVGAKAFHAHWASVYVAQYGTRHDHASIADVKEEFLAAVGARTAALHDAAARALAGLAPAAPGPAAPAASGPAVPRASAGRREMSPPRPTFLDDGDWSALVPQDAARPLVQVASRCLDMEPGKRPSALFAVETLTPFVEKGVVDALLQFHATKAVLVASPPQTPKRAGLDAVPLRRTAQAKPILKSVSAPGASVSRGSIAERPPTAERPRSAEGADDGDAQAAAMATFDKPKEVSPRSSPRTTTSSSAELPRAAAVPPGKMARAASARPATNGSWENQTKVLVVDDSPTQLKMLARHIQRHFDCQVHTASSAMDALNLIERHTFAVVFTDMVMPFMDGFEFPRCGARKRPRCRATRGPLLWP
ncbi:kinase-like domain-containing protein [Pelagophyceae sp. CCMP2097]|nr:kinase-like domain-containing protein [Pelagophyceae sp. CCMP2097]